MKDLLLVGACVVDPSGPERLGLIFEQYKPDAIVLRLVHKQLETHRELKRDIQTEGWLDRMVAKVQKRNPDVIGETYKKILQASGFDIDASEAYCEQYPDCRLHLAESLQNPVEYLAAFRKEKAIGPQIETISQCSLDRLRQRVDQAYLKQFDDVGPVISADSGLYAQFPENHPVQRDQRTAAFIRGVDASRVVYVGRVAEIYGHTGIYKDKPHLANLLEDLSPTRCTLLDADHALDFLL